MTQGVGQSHEEAYRETLDYFACDVGAALSVWARAVSDQHSEARVTFPTPRNPTDIKIERTWRRFLPYCLRSESYKRQNRTAFRQLFSDVQAYGYNRETLRQIDDRAPSDQKVMRSLQKRFFTRRSLRVRDIVGLLHLIRVSESEELNTSRQERDGERAEARAKQIYQRKRRRFEIDRQRQTTRLERSAELLVSPIAPGLGRRRLDPRGND